MKILEKCPPFQEKHAILKILKNTDYNILTYNDIMVDETRMVKKIKKGDYLAVGDNQIVDQGKEPVGGYTNDEEGIYNNTPFIVFGDHTRVIKYIDIPSFIGADGVKVINVKDDMLEQIDMKYLYYYLTYANIPNDGYSRHFKYLRSLLYIVPPIDIQHQIVKVLDQAQQLIDQRKEQIELLDDLIESVFYDMFGDPIRNNREWSVKELESIVRLQRGYDLPIRKRNKAGYIPIYGANGILDKHDNAKFKQGIITGRSGSIGKVFYEFEEFWPLNTTLFSVETYNNNIIYLKYLLEKFKLERFKTGTSVPTLNRNIIHKKRIMDTPLSLQNEFAEKVEVIEQQKQHMEKSLALMKDNYNSLMQRAFNGELF